MFLNWVCTSRYIRIPYVYSIMFRFRIIYVEIVWYTINIVRYIYICLLHLYVTVYIVTITIYYRSRARINNLKKCKKGTKTQKKVCTVPLKNATLDKSAVFFINGKGRF